MKKIYILGLLCALLGSSLFPRSIAQSAVPVAIAAPQLKWAYGGCFTSWCQTGWYASPVVADLNNDGKNEVVWGSYDLVALEGETGNLIWRAPHKKRVWAGLAIDDLDQDGSLDIVVGRNDDVLMLYTSSGAERWTRSPFGAGEVRTVALADLDQDGRSEILAGRAGTGATRQLIAYSSDGNVRPGWPARHDGEPGSGWGLYHQNVAIADMTGDDIPEIMMPTDTHYITGLRPDGSQLPVNSMYGAGKFWSQVGVHVDQTADLRGYAKCETERRPNFAHSSPVIDDLDGDGMRELVVIGNVYICGVSPYVDLYLTPFVFRADRTRWAAGAFDWTTVPADPGTRPLSRDFHVIENNMPAAVSADLDNDGLKEILFSSYDGRVYAYWLDKSQHGSWPFSVPGQGMNFASEPAIADLDNDGQAEVIIGTWPQNDSGRAGQLIILNNRGQIIHQVSLPPQRSGNWNGALGAPTLANVDHDPDLEVVLGTSQSGVVVYDLPNTANARILWSTGRGGFQRSGLAPAAGPSLQVTPASQAIRASGKAHFTVLLRGSSPNDSYSLTASPDRAGLDLQLSSSTITGSSPLTLTIRDTHTEGELHSGIYYRVTLTASGVRGSFKRDITLLVGGTQVLLPIIRR